MSKGEIVFSATSRIVVNTSELLPAGEVLADYMARMFGIAKPIVQQGKMVSGDIGLATVRDKALSGPDAYRILADKHAIVEGVDYGAVALGMMTLLQAAEKGKEGTVLIPAMLVQDKADCTARALQLSVRGGYHSPEFVKKGIELMHFYKVRYLQLHTSEQLWVGAVFDSSNGTEEKMLKANSAWNKKQMDDVIAFAKVRGICLIPHNEMRPNDPFWQPTLTKDFNTTDTFAGYMDEVDSKGVFEWPKEGLQKNERFWNFLKVVTQRSYDQFAKGWPGGKLPYYHIGPVYGEGGCSGADAVKMLTFLKEKNPDIKMMFWNGPGPEDKDLAPYKANIIVDFYSKHWGGTPDGMLKAGWTLWNASWMPLYIQPGSNAKAYRQGKWIFDEFTMPRFSTGGRISSPLIDKDTDDCSAWATGVTGALLSSWDFAGPNQGDGHLNMVIPCIPFFAQHVWNIKPRPYPQSAWEKANSAFEKLSPKVWSLVMEQKVPEAVPSVTATQGFNPRSVDIYWAEVGNYTTSYQVFRSDTKDPSRAVAISEKLPATLFRRLNTFTDSTAEHNKKYWYFVRAYNTCGESVLGNGYEGWTGNEKADIPIASESFDYPTGSFLEGQNGGKGFENAWYHKEATNTPPSIIDGLTYPGLKTSGGALRIQADDADEPYLPGGGRRRPPHTVMLRDLQVPYAKEGTTLWYSYLIRIPDAKRLTSYDCRVNIGRPGSGKIYGGNSGLGFYGETCLDMEVGKTYRVVVRFIYHRGTDCATLWVNPPPEKQPKEGEANLMLRSEDNAVTKSINISIAPYGRGQWDIDELRIGPTYESVSPTL